ncbi:hypothetical protein Y032_0017g3282 [Ancylostoma ceylanicum]|uniref:VWFA domain-containing protein n=1 Tax=Ancylostoma ceylanicum TaxID=53326 RepID=A0A016V4C3_9BILA|nr:hypothetical protein Y032_0017g3282 [Ancylostoma ceylanicum]
MRCYAAHGGILLTPDARPRWCCAAQRRTIAAVGRIVPEEEAVSKELPTDESGNVIYPITKPDGSPLPTDASGNYITDEGTIIEKDEEGKPLGPDGQPLPTDETGNYIYPAVGPDGSPLPTDMHRRPIYPVVGKDGRPLPTDESGAPLGSDGKPIPTDESGKPLGEDGSLLPTDASGNYVSVPSEEAVTKELPTDESGNVIYPITKPDGSPLPTDASGNYITDEGTIIEKDEEGKPLGPDGQPLPTDETGNYIYPAVGPDGSPLPTDMHRRPIYPVVGKDGRPLPTDESGAPLGSDGKPIPTDESGKPLGEDGSPLPTDASGNYVSVPSEEAVTKELPTDESGNVIYPITKPDGSPLPTDASGNYITDEGTIIEKDEEGKPLGPDGQPLPTDETGNYIYPAVGPDGSPLPTDMHRRPIYPVVGKDGRPLPTDESGAPLGSDGKPIPTDESGKPLGEDGSPLPTDASGNYVSVPSEEAVTKELPTDESGNVIYPITKPDGSPLPTDASGNYITDEGTIIEKDEEGKPLGPDGQPLPTDETGNYIYPAVGPDGSPLPTDMHRRPIYPVVGKDGRPLPTDESGAPLGSDGKPIPTDESGKPLGEDGSPLPTDASGNYVSVPSEEAVTKELPTDESGNVIYPITKPDGSPLPTDASGNYITDEGTIIEKDEEGKPLGPDGQPLPTDETGNYIYPAVGPDGSPLPTDMHRRPIYPVVGKDGRPLPTDESGAPLGSDGKPIPTDESGKPLGEDGSPLPTDASGNYVSVPSEEAVTKELPTDESGNVIYPITKPDGSPLPTDASGNYITDEGTIIEKDEEGKPLGPDGQPLPTDETGNYIYPAVGPDGSPLPTDMHRRPIYPVVGKDGRPLPTDESGAPLGSDGKPIPTDESGKPLGEDGSPLPTDASGNYVSVPEEEAVSKELPTDESGNVIYPITKPDGSPPPDAHTVHPLPTDESGNYLYPVIQPDEGLITTVESHVPTDTSGTPHRYVAVHSDGRPLPTDQFGNAIGENGLPLPTDSLGRPVDHSNSPFPTNSLGEYIVPPSRRLSQYCVISSHVELIAVLDTSNSVKVLDYRVMKELLKTFLMDHFDLSQNKVRVGVVKYGDTAEVPISLGDYDHVDDLLHRISETRRVKGKPRLDLALKEVAGELLISGSENVPKFVLLLKNGASTDDFREAAETLKKDVGAQVFVVEAGDDESYGQDAQLTTDDKVIRIKQWRGTDSETLGPIADMICKIAPTDSTGEVTWPVRKPTVQTSTPSRACSQIDYPADVIIMLDSSENFSPEEFDEMKESVAELVDAGFDLAPDVARIGFVIYSDKVAVPVALGHYEDKIDLIQQISDSTKINDGVAIALYGLNAARQQFQLHGRENATRIVIMITNGKNRGNAAPAAEDLRDTYNVQLFIIAVNADSEGLATLKRIAGTEYPDRIYEVGTAFELDDHTAAISRHLCGYTTPAQGVTPTEPTFHRTTKRDVQAALTPQPWTTPRLMKYPPLCSDGIKRPYQMNILVDVTSRSTQEDFRLVMDHLAQFFQKRFAQDDNMLSFNLMTVNSQKVLDARAGLSVSDIGGALNDVTQDSDDEESAKLGAGIDSLVEMSNDNYIKGSFKIMLIVSADSTSSDAALPSAEYAADDFGNNIIGLSVRKPSTDLLTRMAGTGTRVIHLDWTSPNELFNSWFAYSVCDYVTATTVKTPTTPTKARPTVARRITAPPATIATPTNVEAVPKSPNSFTVTWTCCTNTKSNYTILYTHDPSIPSQHWQQQSATCRDSFGKLIDRLPTDHDYTVCVVTAQSNITDIEKESCTQVTLNKNTTVEDHQPVEIAPCNCLCVEGKAILRPSCDLIVDEYRPIATLPPATEDECPCRIQSHAGRCPSGYLFKKGQCYGMPKKLEILYSRFPDIDECANGNGGCSHGCVNTPGGHYCACPYGMTRDPLDPNTCVNSANA